MTAKVLITGAGGMLGQALVEAVPEHVTVLACTRQQLDITDAQAVEQAVLEFQPHVIINAAAYTQVDRAEQEPEQAYAVNHDGALHLAQAAARLAIPLLHVSTDYVFDGVFPDGVCRPYREDDMPNPLNVYGASKLAGEQAIQATHQQAVIVRSSTLFSLQQRGGDFVSWVINQAKQSKT
ncbi:MAG: SDR family oxidoreductase, partial [Saezia sp.]